MRKILTAIVAIALLAPGCAWYRGKLGSAPDPAEVARIVPGETSRTQVEKWLGAPNAVARLGAGDVYLYRYDEAKVFLAFLFLVNWGNLDVKPDRLLVAFGEDGVVTHVAYRQQAQEARFRLKP